MCEQCNGHGFIVSYKVADNGGSGRPVIVNCPNPECAARSGGER